MNSTLGYTGQPRDPVTGGYNLGNGYRIYLPGLMRFTAPDDLSPFGAGGINPYTYCAGDPINRADPSGHMPMTGLLEDIDTAVVDIPLNVAHAEPAPPVLPHASSALDPQPLHQATNAASAAHASAWMSHENQGPIHGFRRMDWHDAAHGQAEIFTFEDNPEGAGKRLTVTGHGEKAFMAFNADRGAGVDAHDLASALGDVSQYQSLRLLTCESADGEENSLAQQLATLTRKPVTGFSGRLGIPQHMEASLMGRNYDILHGPDGFGKALAEQVLHRQFQGTTFKPNPAEHRARVFWPRPADPTTDAPP